MNYGELKFSIGQEVYFSRSKDIETIKGEIIGFFVPPGKDGDEREYYYQMSYLGKVTNKEGNQVDENLLTSLPAKDIYLTRDETVASTSEHKRKLIDERIKEIELFKEGHRTQIKFMEEQLVEADTELKRYIELRERFKGK